MADELKKLSKNIQDSQNAIQKLKEIQKKNIIIYTLQDEIVKTTAELIAFFSENSQEIKNQNSKNEESLQKINELIYFLSEKDKEIKNLRSKNDELVKILNSKDKELSQSKNSGSSLLNLEQENISLKKRIRYLVTSRAASSDSSQNTLSISDSINSVTHQIKNSSFARITKDEKKSDTLHVSRIDLNSRINSFENQLEKIKSSTSSLVQTFINDDKAKTSNSVAKDEKSIFNGRKVSTASDSINKSFGETILESKYSTYYNL